MAAVISTGVCLLAASGCGGTESGAERLTGVDAWLEDACGRAVDWRRELNDANQEFQASLKDAATPQAVQEVLLEFLRRGEDESARVARHFESVDPPPVEDGESFARSLRASFDAVREIFSEGSSDAQALETGDPAAFQDEVREVVRRVDDELNDWPSPFQAALDEHGGTELREGFKSVPSCLTFSRGG